ncbi:hypothetical protein BK643_05830 [Pseudomonas protegens]|nr:hypothetical protein BK643_05830 [Pseudomonas protegens]
MRQCSAIPGVLPILESATDLEQADKLWFVTGLASEVTTELGRQPQLSRVVTAISAYADVLTAVHDLGISHRDIKPENLFFYNDQWAVGDFGLASFEGKRAVTAGRGKLGPLFYMAPEMFNNPRGSDGRSADVYSLAKTLWKLASGQEFPLPGSYAPMHQAFRIGTYLPGQTGTSALDQLIAAATVFQPSDRPSMSQVAAELKAWLAPRPPKNMPIKIDIGQHFALLDDWRLSQEAEQDHLANRSQACAQVMTRVLETVAPFMDELKKSIEILSDSLTCSSHVSNGQSQLIVAIAGKAKAALTLTLEVEPTSHPLIRVGARIIFDWQSNAGLKLLLWGTEVSFLDSGSEENFKLDQLCKDVTSGLQDALGQSVSLIAGREKKAENAEVIQFNILKQSGQPAAGAKIHILDLEGVSLAVLNATDGTAGYTLKNPEGAIAFISHSDSSSAIIANLKPSNEVILSDHDGASSMVRETSWTGIQGMEGSFSLIHDRQRRMYMHVDGFSADGGETGAITLALGKGVRLKDKRGNQVILTPRAVIGRSYALDLQKELVVP